MARIGSKRTLDLELPDRFFPCSPLKRIPIDAQYPAQPSLAEKADLFGISQSSKEILNIYRKL